MALRSRASYAALAVVLYFWNPWSISSRVSDVAYSALRTASPAREERAPNSLKAAIANVTTDFDQLALLVQGFFERLPDNSTEQLFRDYLQARAQKSHKEFERFLDWLLSIYNILWPFVVMVLITRLSSAGSPREAYEPAEAVGPDLQRRDSLRKQPSRYGLRERHLLGPEAPHSSPNLLAASVSEGNLSMASQ